MDKLENLVKRTTKTPGWATERLNQSPVLWLIQEKLQILRKKLVTVSRTSKPWLHYMRYEDILKQFIGAASSGN